MRRYKAEAASSALPQPLAALPPHDHLLTAQLSKQILQNVEGPVLLAQRPRFRVAPLQAQVRLSQLQ